MPGKKIDDRPQAYKTAIKTLKKLFSIANVSNITITGGEPFLHDRFAEIILFCRMKNKEVTIISNGNSVNKEDYKTMIDLGVGLFEFPFHSIHADAHDYLTGVKESWEKSLQSIKDVISLGGKVVPVIVITKYNYDHVNDTIMYLNDLGLKRIMLNRFNIGGKGISENSNLKNDLQNLRNVYKKADRLASEYKISLSSNVCTPFCVLDPHDYPNIRFSSCSINVFKRPLTLEQNGNLRVCNHSPIVFGNIFKDNLNDILSSDYIKQWGDVVPDYCSNCNKYKICLGGCRAASEQLGLTLDSVDPVVNDCLVSPQG